MKIRNSFVSNSSSSSFVVSEEDATTLYKKQVQCYQVESLRESLGQMVDDLTRLQSTAGTEHLPEISMYMSNMIYVCKEHIEKLNKEKSNSWITEQIDDHWASEQGLYDYKTFERR
jgi:hypothetical protein